MRERGSSSSDEKSEEKKGTSLPPSGSETPDKPPVADDTPTTAPTRLPAATVFTPHNQSFVVDQDAQYPYCTYKVSGS